MPLSGGVLAGSGGQEPAQNSSDERPTRGGRSWRRAAPVRNGRWAGATRGSRACRGVLMRWMCGLSLAGSRPVRTSWTRGWPVMPRVAALGEQVSLHTSVAQFGNLIETDPVVGMYVRRMIEQVPTTRAYSKRHLSSPEQLLRLIKEVLTMAPEFVFVFHTHSCGHTSDMHVPTLALHGGPLDLRCWSGQASVGHLGGPTAKVAT